MGGRKGWSGFRQTRRKTIVRAEVGRLGFRQIVAKYLKRKGPLQ
jgi:hypothetical protein